MKLLVKSVALVLLTAELQFGVGQTVVRVAPPPPVHVGVVGRPPHPGFVWIEGYQRWDGRRYVWVSGRWVRPPRPGAVWVSPAWTGRGSGWVFRSGYWR
jgi:WXXGXW repeat (2 copies)